SRRRGGALHREEPDLDRLERRDRRGDRYHGARTARRPRGGRGRVARRPSAHRPRADRRPLAGRPAGLSHVTTRRRTPSAPADRVLEDERAEEVQAWMKTQDDYARGELAKLPGRDELARRLAQLLYYDAVGAPSHHGGRYFYTRKHADKEKTIVYWKQGEHGA